MPKSTALYRHYDREGILLYIGISCNTLARTAGHKFSEWFAEISSIKIEYHKSRKLALEAEKKAIKNENPLYNKLFSENQKEKESKTEYSSFTCILTPRLVKSLKNYSAQRGRTASAQLRIILQELFDGHLIISTTNKE